MTPKPVSYAFIRQTPGFVRSGDVALCCAGSIEGRIITDATGQTYSHAAMLAWLNQHRQADSGSCLMLTESLQHAGKRMVPFSKEVEAWPGYWDLFRPRDKYPRLAGSGYDGEAAAAWMARAVESGYGYLDLVRVALRRHSYWPLCCIPAPRNSDSPDTLRDCSAQVHAALRLHGGPCLREHDCDVQPGDMADTRTFDYLGTVHWTEEQVQDAIASIVAACPVGGAA